MTVAAVAIPAAPTDSEKANAKYQLAGKSTWVRFEADTAALRVYFRQEDFNAGTGYLLVATGVPVDVPLEADAFWLAGDGASSDVQLLVIHK